MEANDLIFTGDAEEIKPGIAEDVDGNEAEPEEADEIDNEPMSQQERSQLLAAFAALAAEIEARIADSELRLVDNYRQLGADSECFSRSKHYVILESLMELRPLIHQTERSILHDTEVDASIALRRLKRKADEVSKQAEGLLTDGPPKTITRQ